MEGDPEGEHRPDGPLDLEAERRLVVLASNPAPAELASLGVPASLLGHIGDEDERPRVLVQDGFVLLVLRVPVAGADATDYLTHPLSYVVTADILAAVHHESDPPQWLSPLPTLIDQVRAIAARYLELLDELERRIEAAEVRLQTSQRNREVIELLAYQKAHVRFGTALRGNLAALRRLQHSGAVRLAPAAAQRYEEALVEMHQAMESAELARNLLSDMMDAFASIISNNLNEVVKALTAFTIVLSIPTVIASLYGMNVLLPGEENDAMFAIVLGISAAAAGGVALLFRRMDWL